MAKEIVLDTETTGFSYGSIDRIISVGLVIVENGKIKKKGYYREFNPETARSSAAAEAVHGLTHAHLQTCKTFEDGSKKLLKILRNADRMVGHNITFDRNFLYAELERIGKEELLDDIEVVDTAQLARRRITGSKYNLDHCCKVFGIRKDDRKIHNAYEDAMLTAQVYLQLSELEENDTFIEGTDGDLGVNDPENLLVASKKQKKLAKKAHGIK